MSGVAERQIAARYFQKLTPVRSIPIKPAATFKAAGLWKNDETIGMSRRQAAALLASATENRVVLKPGAAVPRRLHLEGVEYVIENGVGRDMISSGMIDAAEGEVGREMLRLSAAGLRYIIETLVRDSLLYAGVLAPE